MAKKEFNAKLYGIIAIILVGAVLAVITFSTFTSRYTAYYEDRVATTYVKTIVETGDGYNAYKNTLLSKDGKFGDFIRKTYLYPAIYEGYYPGGSTDGLKGLNDKSLKGEKTLNDDGSLQGKLINTMYTYYELLLKKYGSWDKYGDIFTEYIKVLKLKRNEIFGDTYFDDEVFFTCLEANVSTYGQKLTGTEDEFDKNTGVQTSFAKKGIYEEKYGEDYKFTYTATDILDNPSVTDDSTSYVPSGAKGPVDIEDIKGSKIITVQVKCNNEVVIDGIDIAVVQIGKTWYVDTVMSDDTSPLYNFYK
ncbi:MAG: hypothetical protein K6F64_02145 [Clostridia bacterium]|nr:hypothetical protein [Clostridia bacterium]